MEKEKDASLEFGKSRMAIYIGRIRSHKGISQGQLAEGLCTGSLLARFECGGREIDKLLADALLERLGKSADLFIHILNQRDGKLWRMREHIKKSLAAGKLNEAEKSLTEYRTNARGAVHEQFAEVMELNLSCLNGANPEMLQERLLQVIRLTQPRFGEAPLSSLLLSQNEQMLILEWFKIERASGSFTWRELLTCFYPERDPLTGHIPLFAALIFRVLEEDCAKARFLEALDLCEYAQQKIGKAFRLKEYIQLLEWKKRIMGQMGWDELPGKGGITEDIQGLSWLLQHLRELRAAEREPLWLSCKEERGIHLLSEIISKRRALLGLSEDELALGICDIRTLRRVEAGEASMQKEKRCKILQRLNLSGDQYDYEVVTEDYEDYLARSRLGRHLNRGEILQAWSELEKLKRSCNVSYMGVEVIAGINRQYLEMTEGCIREGLPEKNPDKITLKERIIALEHALSLTLPSLPLTLDKIEKYPAGLLSVNEITILSQLALCYKKQGKLQECLAILSFVKRCMEQQGEGPCNALELYTLCMSNLASALGDAKRYEESDQLSKNCLRLCMEEDKMDFVSGFLYNIAWNQEKRGEGKEECLPLLQKAYAVAIMIGNKRNQQHIEEYCKRTYQSDLLA